MIWFLAVAAWLACSVCTGLAVGAFMRAGKGPRDG